MNFNYQARTKEGEVRTGQIEASSNEAAAALLQKHGFYVTFLEEALLPIYAKEIKLFGRIPQKEIVLFSRQLSILFRSKVSLIESLRTIAVQIKNEDFRDKIFKIAEEVEAGVALSKALSHHPQVFSSFYTAMVKSGETSGKLSEVLSYLADHLEREYNIMSKAKGALIYPLLIVFVVGLVLILMIFYVVPNLAAFYAQSAEQLPAITTFVINSSNFLRQWWWVILFALILLTAFFFRYYFTLKGKSFFDKGILKVPLVGNLLRQIYLARFSENLSTLISAGLPIVESLERVGDIIGNSSYKEIIFKARDRVKRGEAISSVLTQNTELFPPIFTQMVFVGEKTGSLDETLKNITDFYRQEIDRGINNVLSILEPLLVVFLGMIVGGIMLAILMPLYRTMSF